MPSHGMSKACRRCGVIRSTQTNRPLCRDCRAVMSDREIAEWYDEPPVWLKKRLEAA